jgi:hypothetical protein
MAITSLFGLQANMFFLKKQRGSTLIEGLCVVALSIFLLGGTAIFTSNILEAKKNEYLASQYAEAMIEVSVALNSYVEQNQSVNGLVSVQTLFDEGYYSAENTSEDGTFESGQRFYGLVNGSYGFPLSIAVAATGEMVGDKYIDVTGSVDLEKQFYRSVTKFVNRTSVAYGFSGAIVHHDDRTINFLNDTSDEKDSVDDFFLLTEEINSTVPLLSISLQRTPGYALFSNRTYTTNDEATFASSALPYILSYTGYSTFCPDYAIKALSDEINDGWYSLPSGNEKLVDTFAARQVKPPILPTSFSYSVCIPVSKKMSESLVDITINPSPSGVIQGVDLGPNNRLDICRIDFGIFGILDIQSGESMTRILYSHYKIPESDSRLSFVQALLVDVSAAAPATSKSGLTGNVEATTNLWNCIVDNVPVGYLKVIL